MLQPLDPGELRFRSDQLARMFTDRGVTYDYAGEERPFPLDLIPRVIDAVEWDLIARGVKQRVLALEAFLADVYGPRQRVRRRGAALAGGLHVRPIPPRGGRAGPAERGPVPRGRHRPGPRRAGRVRVLEDNVRIPSGVSYVIENRLAMTRTFPALFAEHTSTRWRSTPRLLAALRRGGARRHAATRSWWCSPRASPTRPISSTPCWPG